MIKTYCDGGVEREVSIDRNRLFVYFVYFVYFVVSQKNDL